MPNVMYRNQAGQGFADVTTSGGLGHLQKGHGVVFADLDNDGDQDIVYADLKLHQAGFGSAYAVAVHKNDGDGDNPDSH